MTLAVTREISGELGNCQLTSKPRVAIDIQLARRQHREYESALASLGCRMVRVPTEPGLPDSVFIEDTALVLDEIAVLCRPGVKSRRPEVTGVGEALGRYRDLAAVGRPGQLDGGDLLRIDRNIYAGLSTRSNREGIEQLQRLTVEFGYTVQPVKVRGCLHLKSAVTQVAPGKLLLNRDWIDPSIFSRYELIETDPSEAHAANALRVGDSVIYATSFPRTRDRLAKHGIETIAIDTSELQKAEGGVTCCSLVFEA